MYEDFGEDLCLKVSEVDFCVNIFGEDLCLEIFCEDLYVKIFSNLFFVKIFFFVMINRTMLFHFSVLGDLWQRKSRSFCILRRWPWDKNSEPIILQSDHHAGHRAALHSTGMSSVEIWSLVRSKSCRFCT